MKPTLDAKVYKKMCDLAKNAQLQLLVNNLDKINFSKLIRSNLETSKGDFGKIAIIGGNRGMHGALYLSGRAAMLCGAGKVVLASLDTNFKLDMQMPEIVTDNYNNILKHITSYSVIIIGPGLGQDKIAQKLIDDILQINPTTPLIFDADALNLIAKNVTFQLKFNELANKIITPHPMEASRLLNCSLAKIQDNRITAITLLNERYNALTLLKGYGSLIYDGKSLFINPTGNTGMSNAGQGDILNGIIGAIVAQQLDLLNALRLGVYLHGMAGDYLVNELYSGRIGVLATEVAMKARILLNLILTPKL